MMVTMNKNLNEELNMVEEVNEPFPFKGVIFDMDGTLIESTEADYLAWQRTFADFGRELTFFDYKPLLGIKSADVIRKTLGVIDEDEVKKCLATKLQYFKEIMRTQGIQPVLGAKQLLQQVKNLPGKMALATSSRREKMNMVMTDLKFLDYFDEIVTGEEVINSKPAPDVFLLAAKKLNLNPEDCVVLEDAVSGVSAAKAAGMKCIAITTTHSADLLTEADIVIDSFDKIDFHQLCLQLV